MGVSKNRGTPKSSILIRFSIMNHPFWGTPIFGNTHIPIFGIWQKVSLQISPYRFHLQIVLLTLNVGIFIAFGSKFFSTEMKGRDRKGVITLAVCKSELYCDNYIWLMCLPLQFGIVKWRGPRLLGVKRGLCTRCEKSKSMLKCSVWFDHFQLCSPHCLETPKTWPWNTHGIVVWQRVIFFP